MEQDPKQMPPGLDSDVQRHVSCRTGRAGQLRLLGGRFVFRDRGANGGLGATLTGHFKWAENLVLSMGLGQEYGNPPRNFTTWW